MPVSDVVKTKAGASALGGKLEAGAIKVGSRVVLVPGHEVGVVKSLDVDGQVCAAGGWICSSMQPAKVARAGTEVWRWW